jgi:CRP/FNR family transcriptional regulator
MPNSDWQDCFPELSQSQDPIIQQLLKSAHSTTLPPGKTVFRRGSTCENYLLIAKGRVKTFLISASGREILLYHVNPGESCVLTTSCLLGGDAYPAEGITETSVDALMIHRKAFDQALGQSTQFRQFVFANMGKRFADVIARMEALNFTHIDARLAQTLLQHANGQTYLMITHQSLADEMGTAREVVSRHLKSFEQQGLIKLGRGEIRILNPKQLNTATYKT